MMTMREYWNTAFMTASEEEEEMVLTVESELYEAVQEDDFDLEAWCAEHDVEYDEQEILHWCWDMCGE